MLVKRLAETLHAGLAGLGGPELSPGQENRLMTYLALLERWNRTYNLTAVKNPVDMVIRHLLDSLSVTPFIPGGRLLDAGTGAGLPGIPLAIVLPGLEVTLLDSSGKKVRFLGHVRRQLGLENIYPVQQRLEAFTPAMAFDAVISRAFSSLAAFARAARHLAQTPLTLLAMKGRFPEDELLELPGWARVKSIEKLEVPGLQQERHLVIMSINP